MRVLALALVAAAWLWPATLAGAVSARVQSPDARWPWLVYAISSRVCHQRHERSFHTSGVQWPVCARCAGLYLAAPLGALAVLAASRRSRRAAPPTAAAFSVGLVAIAAVPTAITLVVEWTGLAQPGNLWRMITALPLGAVIAAVLVRTATERARPIG